MMLRAYMSKTALRRSRTPLQSVSRSSGFLPLGFALLVLFTCPVVEAGQQSTDSSASESPAPKEASATLPQVTVSAQRQVLEKQAHTFVKKLTGSAWAPDEGAHLLGMWRLPVCLIVAGLPREQGEFIFNRVTEVATSAGAHPGQSGCHPNLYIVVTAQPVELLTAWYKRDRRMFEKSMLPAVKRFLARSLPVRIWYNTQLTGEDGSPGTDHGTALGGGLGGTSGQMSATGPLNSNGLMNLLADIPTFQGVTGGTIGTRLGVGAVHDLASVIVIVDFTQMEGVTWAQLADYIAMAALTNVDPNRNYADVPSILALFNMPTESRPTGLSDWDKAYLKALYHTERMSPLQRVAIVREIVEELAPAK